MTPEQNRAKTKRWRESNPVAARRIALKAYLKRFYGLTVERLDELFVRQNGRCAVCERVLISPTDETREFKGHAPHEVARVDHDHTTGQIRGLLCFTCNTGLGHFREDEQIMLKAVGYLRVSATQQAQPDAAREAVSEIEPAMGPRIERSRGNRRDELYPFFN